MKSRQLYVLFTISLIIRLIFAYIAPNQYQIFGDTEEYLEVGKRLCASGAYPFEHIFLPTFRAPGFPVFLSLISGCFSISNWGIALILMVIDSLSCVIGMEIVFLLSKGQRVLRALIFGFAYSLYPLFIQQSVTIQSECLTVFAILASLYLILVEFPLLAGVFLGVAVLTRPSALMLFFLVFSTFILSGSSFRSRVFYVFLGAVLTILPWSIYASVNTGKPILVNDSFCYSAYRGARLELTDVYTAKDAASFKNASAASEVVLRIAESEISDDNWCKEALTLIKEKPTEELRLAMLKFIAFYRPWPHPAAHSKLVVAAVGSITIILYVLFLVTLLQKSSSRGIRNAKWVFTIYILLVGLFHVPHQVSNRYRVPFVDPLILVTAAAYITTRKKSDTL